MIVMVLGMHRSGTSLVAGLLHGMGIHMGDDLLAADRFNPHGYYEDLNFFDLNREILRAAGGNWAEPPGLREILAVGRWFAPEMRQVLDYKRAQDHADWGWKDPRTALTVQLWRGLLREDEDLRVIHVVRDPDEVVASLMRRQQVAMEQIRQWVAEGRLQGAEADVERDEGLADRSADEWDSLRYAYEHRIRDFLTAEDGQIPSREVSYDDLIHPASKARDLVVGLLAEFVDRDPAQALMVARSVTKVPAHTMPVGPGGE